MYILHRIFQILVAFQHRFRRAHCDSQIFDLCFLFNLCLKESNDSNVIMLALHSEWYYSRHGSVRLCVRMLAPRQLFKIYSTAFGTQVLMQIGLKNMGRLGSLLSAFSMKATCDRRCSLGMFTQGYIVYTTLRKDTKMISRL